MLYEKIRDSLPENDSSCRLNDLGEAIWNVISTLNKTTRQIFPYKLKGYVLRTRSSPAGEWKLVGCIAKSITTVTASDEMTRPTRGLFDKLCEDFWNSFHYRGVPGKSEGTTVGVDVGLVEEGRFNRFGSVVRDWSAELMVLDTLETRGASSDNTVEFLELTECLLNADLPCTSDKVDKDTWERSVVHSRAEQLANSLTGSYDSDNCLELLERVTSMICLRRTPTVGDRAPLFKKVTWRLASSPNKTFVALPVNDRGVRVLLRSVGYALHKRSEAMLDVAMDTAVNSKIRGDKAEGSPDLDQKVINERQLFTLFEKANPRHGQQLVVRRRLFALYNCGLDEGNLHLLFENLSDEVAHRPILDVVVLEGVREAIQWKVMDYLFSLCWVTTVNVNGVLGFYLDDGRSLSFNSIVNVGSMTTGANTVRELLSAESIEGDKVTGAATSLLTECNWLDRVSAVGSLAPPDRVLKALDAHCANNTKRPGTTQITFVGSLHAVLKTEIRSAVDIDEDYTRQLHQRRMSSLLNQTLERGIKCSGTGDITKAHLVKLGKRIDGKGGSGTSVAATIGTYFGGGGDDTFIQTPGVCRDDSFLVLKTNEHLSKLANILKGTCCVDVNNDLDRATYSGLLADIERQKRVQ
jgi:hypothetical protein